MIFYDPTWGERVRRHTLGLGQFIDVGLSPDILAQLSPDIRASLPSPEAQAEAAATAPRVVHRGGLIARHEPSVGAPSPGPPAPGLTDQIEEQLKKVEAWLLADKHALYVGGGVAALILLPVFFGKRTRRR